MAEGLVPAFVLHRRPYGDSSFLLEVLTDAHGRLPAIAKGAASSSSARKGLLQPFVPLWMEVRGRGEVKTLGKLEARSGGARLSGKALLCGFYVNELFIRLVAREDHQEGLFDLYERTLATLSVSVALDLILRRFELDLLKLLGFGLDLHQEPDGLFVFRHKQGLVPAGVQDRFAVRGSTLLALDKCGELDAEQRMEARNLMRLVLAAYLGDKPLKSRELFL